MLGKNFLKLGETFIPNPISFSENYSNIENVGQAESGKELVMVTRLQKRSWSLTCNVSSYWLEQLKSLCNDPSTTLTFRGEVIPVRSRITSAALAENSVYSPESDGYYVATLEITEI